MIFLPKSLCKRAVSITMLGAMALPASAQVGANASEQLEVEARASVLTYQAMLSETFTDKTDPDSDLSVLTGILPEGFAVTWDSVVIDGETGATTYEGLDISFTSLTGTMGLKFDTASIWGLDEEFLVSRLAGERLDETAILATRIDATGLEMYGVSETIDALIDVWIPQDEQIEMGGFGFPRFESTTERLIIENFKLGTFAYSPMTQDQLYALDESGDFSEALPIIHGVQKVTAALAALGYEASVSTGNKAVFQLVVPGEDTLFEFKNDLAGTSDLMGFDIETSVATALSTLMTTVYTQGKDEPNIANFIGKISIEQSEYAELSVLRGMKFNGLMRMVTTATLPDMSNTDLFALGEIANFNGGAGLNGEDVFSYGLSRINAPSFTWFLPNEIEFEVREGNYNLEAIGTFAETILDKAEGSFIDDDPELYVQIMEGLETTMTLLPKTGLDEIDFDFNGGLAWDAETGAAQIAYNLFAPEFGDEQFVLDGKLPTWAQIQNLEGMEGDDLSNALTAMFVTSSAFNGLSWEQTDKGGYDKIMSFAVGIAKAFPEEDWSVMLSSMDPVSMRAIAGMGLRMSKTELPDDVPAEVGPWIDTLASYIATSGGSIKLEVKPDQPLTGLMFAMMSQTNDPSFILEQLGVALTHTPEPRQ